LPPTMPVEPTMRAVRVPGADGGCCVLEGIHARMPGCVVRIHAAKMGLFVT
jgi:hypothetical protein